MSEILIQLRKMINLGFKLILLRLGGFS